MNRRDFLKALGLSPLLPGLAKPIAASDVPKPVAASDTYLAINGRIYPVRTYQLATDTRPVLGSLDPDVSLRTELAVQMTFPPPEEVLNDRVRIELHTPHEHHRCDALLVNYTAYADPRCELIWDFLFQCFNHRRTYC